MPEDSSQTNMPFNPSLIGRAKNAVTDYGTGKEWFIFLSVLFMHFVNVGIPFVIRGAEWFNGLNIAYMWKTPSLVGKLLYTQTIFNTTFWLIIVLFFLFGRGKSWEEFSSNLLVILSIIVTAIFSGITNLGVLGNGGKSIFGTAVEIFMIFVIRNAILKKKYDIVDANYRTILIIFVDFFLINIIQTVFPAEINIINRLIFPVLPLAVLIFMDDSLWRNIFLFVVIAFYLFLFMSASSYVNSQLSAGFSVGEISGKGFLTAKDNFKLWLKSMTTSYGELKNISSGNYYTGQVEQYENEPLGVFLEDIEASDSEFIEGETVTVWATLKAYTLENNKINIDVKCYAKEGIKGIEGEVSPKGGHFEVESYEEEFITCTFKELSKAPGYYPVIFNATFDFTTQSYLKTYYIDKERKRVYNSENIDIFTEFGLTDKDPVTRFTNGPIKIGMGTTTPLPVGVPQKKDEFSSFLGVTLDNNWKGNIRNINYLYISLPEGLTINQNDAYCKENFKSLSGNALYQYKLSDTALATDNKKNYKLPKSYKCSLNLDSRDQLLGKTPLSIKYFNTEVKYNYIITEQTSVTVKKKS